MADEVTPQAGELVTANYGWVKPTVGSSDDAWGGYINTDLDGIDSVVKGVSNVANAAYPASNPSGYVTAAGAASAAPVQSVAGRTGAVTLTHTDITDWTATLAPYALTASVPIASTTTPAMDGTAAVGTGTTWARADHVHPNDTSRLALTGGTLTGPLALAADPTAALGAATKQYADKMLPLVGVTDGSSAPAGQIGQVIQSTLGSQAAASGGPVNLISISLTAGDWDVCGYVQSFNTGATSQLAGNITTTGGSIGSGGFGYAAISGMTIASSSQITLTPARFNITATTTVYLVGQTTFSSGAGTLNGQLRARRAR